MLSSSVCFCLFKERCYLSSETLKIKFYCYLNTAIAEWMKHLRLPRKLHFIFFGHLHILFSFVVARFFFILWMKFYASQRDAVPRRSSSLTSQLITLTNISFSFLTVFFFFVGLKLMYFHDKLRNFNKVLTFNFIGRVMKHSAVHLNFCRNS